MTRRTLRSYGGLVGSLVIAVGLASGCLNPRPEDFPSVNFSEPEEQLGGSGTGSPGNSMDPGSGSVDFEDGEATSAPRPVFANPSIPIGGDDDGDAGAPVSDGGAAAAFAATAADGGAAVSESADGCEQGPGPR